MSKITNDSLTRSGTGCFIAVPVWQWWASKGEHEADLCPMLGCDKKTYSSQSDNASCVALAHTNDRFTTNNIVLVVCSLCLLKALNNTRYHGLLRLKVIDLIYH